MKLAIYALLVVAGLITGCRTGPKGDASGYPTRELTFTEDLTIGRADSDETLFSYVTEVRADPDGNIYVSDSRESTVSAFDADGRFKFAVAGQGQAPGQIQVLQTFYVAGDSILVFDYRPVFVVFDRETGEFVRRHTPAFDVDRYGWPAYPGVAAHGLVGSFPVRPQVTNPEASPFESATRNEVALSIGDGFGAPLWAGSSSERMFYTPTGPNAPLTVSRPTPQGHNSFCAVGRELMYCAENDSLEFDVIRLADGTVSRYSVPFEPLESTAADRDVWLGDMRDENFRAMFRAPDRWRALEDLLIDDTGKLWMQVRVARSDSLATWWVVDPQSDYRAVVSLPDSVLLLSVAAGAAYARVTAESSEQWAARYSFEY